MVGLWGMSEEVGSLYLGTGEQDVFLGRELTRDRDYSEDTISAADRAVRELLERSHHRATQLLTEHRAALDALAQRLLDDETLDQEQVFQIFERADGGMPRHGFPKSPASGPRRSRNPRLSGGLRADSDECDGGRDAIDDRLMGSRVHPPGRWDRPLPADVRTFCMQTVDARRYAPYDGGIRS